MSDLYIILKTARLQAWERAKGELMAMLQTYCGGNLDTKEQYRQTRDDVEKFISKVESIGSEK